VHTEQRGAEGPALMGWSAVALRLRRAIVASKTRKGKGVYDTEINKSEVRAASMAMSKSKRRASAQSEVHASPAVSGCVP